MQRVTDILFFILANRKKDIQRDTETVHKKAAQEADIPSKIIK